MGSSWIKNPYIREDCWPSGKSSTFSWLDISELFTSIMFHSKLSSNGGVKSSSAVTTIHQMNQRLFSYANQTTSRKSRNFRKEFFLKFCYTKCPILLKVNHTFTETTWNYNIVRNTITCTKISCCTRDSACWWFIVKKAKIFWSYVKHFWILAGVRKCRILIGLSK